MPFYLFIFITVCFLTPSCRFSDFFFLSLQNGLTVGPDSLSNEEVQDFVGRYRMMGLSLIDHGEGEEIYFKANEPLPVEVDVHRGFRYEGKVVTAALDPEESFLEITPDHVCYFHWVFKISGKGAEQDIDLYRSSLGRLATSGEETILGCLKKDDRQDSPKSLMPLKGKSYTTTGQDLIFEAAEDSLEELIYYEKEGL